MGVPNVCVAELDDWGIGPLRRGHATAVLRTSYGMVVWYRWCCSLVAGGASQLGVAAVLVVVVLVLVLVVLAVLADLLPEAKWHAAEQLHMHICAACSGAGGATGGAPTPGSMASGAWWWWCG